MSKNIAYDKNGNILPKMAKLKIVTIIISAKLLYAQSYTQGQMPTAQQADWCYSTCYASR